MSNSLRSVITVLAALTASSVAPAQVSEDTEPLVATDMAVAPVQAIVQTLDDEVVLSTGETPDPLAPSDEIATQTKSIRRSLDLTANPEATIKAPPERPLIKTR